MTYIIHLVLSYGELYGDCREGSIKSDRLVLLNCVIYLPFVLLLLL